MMNETGTWAYALETAPPIIESGEDDLSEWDDKPAVRRKTPKK
jgi:hypothetical protein